MAHKTKYERLKFAAAYWVPCMHWSGGHQREIVSTRGKLFPLEGMHNYESMPNAP